MNTPRCDTCDVILHEDCVVVKNDKKFCSLECRDEYFFLRFATETEISVVQKPQLVQMKFKFMDLAEPDPLSM